MRVHCSSGHDTTLTIDDVAIADANGIVIGYRFECPTCSTLNDVAAGPEMLAVLHAFGATSIVAAPPDVAPKLVSTHRELVSLRVLLDHPELVGPLVAPATTGQRQQQPSATPGP